MKASHKKIKAIVIGTSAGGVSALNFLFDSLPESFSIPMIVVLHIGDNPLILEAFHTPKGMILKEADEKEIILKKHIYFAPSGYHLLVEEDFSFSLSAEEKIQYARPSIDITMETAASAYRDNLLGIVLTGANEDGADGLYRIKKNNGLTITQDLNEAQYPTMPQAAFNKTDPDYVLPLKEIGQFMAKLEGHL